MHMHQYFKYNVPLPVTFVTTAFHPTLFNLHVRISTYVGREIFYGRKFRARPRSRDFIVFCAGPVELVISKKKKMHVLLSFSYYLYKPDLI